MERTENIPGLSLEVESLVAHLQILGYWPVRWHYIWERRRNNNPSPQWRYGVRNDVQLICLRWDKVYMELPVGNQIEDIEWWQVTDKAVRLIAYSLDNTLAGW